MPFFVCIIYSPNLNRFYTGTTEDINRKILEHNSNKYRNSFTSKGMPWESFLEIECKSSGQAYKVEKFIKQMKSTIFIKSWNMSRIS
jgi:putative endonuclease